MPSHRSGWLFSLLAFLTSTACAADSAPSFDVDVASVLSKAGCNAGTCHGNLNGKGGLKLSLRGQDAWFDYHALVSSARGRRIRLAAPEESLLLKKATGQVAHRGGIRFAEQSAEYDVLFRWLQSGAVAPDPRTPQLTRIEVEPTAAIVRAPAAEVPIKVRAFFADGRSFDVTDRACYELSNLVASVSEQGRVARNKFGETTLIVRYLQQQVPVPIAFVPDRADFQWSQPPPSNEIDRHVFAKLERLRINPSELCDDTTFVRRAFLDAIGRLPTADEARAFVYDASSDKRSRLIDDLLKRPEFADFWALKWADVLRVEEKVLDVRGVEVFHAWIRDSIARAKPIDAFVREMVTGTGNTFEHPPANYYRANRDPSTRGETTARLFLGTRLQCAKCHNHPFDRWTQDDYYQWASVFSQLDYELGDNKRRDKLDKNEFVGEQVVLIKEMDEVRNPTSGGIAPPKFLGDQILDKVPQQARLDALADWLTSPNNELFAKSQANFIWYHVMGRGLVEPLDDFRLTNLPSNVSLLDWLAEELVASNFDLRSLVRQIMNSRTYQLSSAPNETNGGELIGFSRAIVRRLPAEVIVDMQSDVLDLPAEFIGYEERKEIRAVQIPGVQRKRLRDGSPKSGDRMLKTFGKPARIMSCECERSNETTLKQAFSLVGNELSERLATKANRVHRLAASQRSDSEVVDELYWTALSRPPTDREKQVAIEMIAEVRGKPPQSIAEFPQWLVTSRRADVVEDLAWALLNAKEFLFRF